MVTLAPRELEDVAMHLPTVHGLQMEKLLHFYNQQLKCQPTHMQYSPCCRVKNGKSLSGLYHLPCLDWGNNPWTSYNDHRYRNKG